MSIFTSHCVAHQNQVHWRLLIHVHGVDAVYSCQQGVWIVVKMLKVVPEEPLKRFEVIQRHGLY